jgi:protein-disulfide isomerase
MRERSGGADVTEHTRRYGPVERDIGNETDGAPLSRRAVLAGAATVALGGLAGCGSRTTAEAGRRSLPENPVAKNLDSQPRLGRPRSETAITLVTFDDPHCSYCREFHENGFQTIESEWIDTGRATLYVRGHSVTGGWGPAALHALEAARQRDERAYWDLVDRYFEHQDELTGDALAERTRSFVAGADVDVDADAVARAVAEKPHTEAVETDERAAEAALSGDGDATPTTFVFEGGEFRTTLGDEDFAAFRAAVESDG